MMSKKIEDADSIVVSPTILAKAFGLTDRRVRQLAKEGVLEKAGHGRYNFIKCVQNYIVYLRANTELKETKTEEEVNFEKEHALLEKAKREKAEIELQVMKGEVHLSEDVETVMNDMLANFRSRILSMPSKLAPILVSTSDVNTIQETIQTNCFEALEELKNYDPKDFYNEKYIDYDEDAIEEGGVGEEENKT